MYLDSAEKFSLEARKNLHLLFRPQNKSLHILLRRRKRRRIRDNAISNTPRTNALNFVKKWKRPISHARRVCRRSRIFYRKYYHNPHPPVLKLSRRRKRRNNRRLCHRDISKSGRRRNLSPYPTLNGIETPKPRFTIGEISYDDVDDGDDDVMIVLMILSR